MKLLKTMLKFSFLAIILVLATMFVYHQGTKEYDNYLERNKNDEAWINANIKLVEDFRIGHKVYRVSLPRNLKIDDSVYNKRVNDEIIKKLINNYGINSPLLIYNPFRSELPLVNIYFNTGEKYRFEYFVTTEYISTEEGYNFVRIVNEQGEDVFNNRHHYELKGFVKGRNNLLIRILDENDVKIGAENFIINIPNGK